MVQISSFVTRVKATAPGKTVTPGPDQESLYSLLIMMSEQRKEIPCFRVAHFLNLPALRLRQTGAQAK